MYSFKNWLDRVTEFTDRYRETANADGTTTHTKVPGEVIQAGTPQNAANFNNLEGGVLENSLVLAEHTRTLLATQRSLANLAGEAVTFTAPTRIPKYPAPAVQQTIALAQRRNNTAYDVAVRIVSTTLPGGIVTQGDPAGVVGTVLITDKLLNGFKVAYTGSAQSVTLEFGITGGMESRAGA